MNARPLTAALLRRLGEAADGYRTGEPVYVVACYDDPRDDLRVFEREADALEHLARAGARFGMFGPFATPVDGSASGSRVREAAATLGEPASTGEVVEVTVSLRDEAGAERTIRLDARGHDALFWSLSAIDKFAVPYYARTDGAGFAVEMRRRAMVGPVCALAHLPRSDYVGLGDEEDFEGYGAPAGSLRVDAVTLTIREGGGRREVRLDGREHDSVFWSLSAIDKFAVPYYARTDGAGYAAEMRRRVLATGLHAISHLPDTMWAPLEAPAAAPAAAVPASRPEPMAA